jgi:hypothetical protein
MLRAHDRLGQLISSLIAKTHRHDLQGVLLGRAFLDGQLRVYFLSEAEFVRRITERSGEGMPIDALRHFVAEREVVEQDWRSYMEEWSAEAVNADWPCFTTETSALIEDVNTHLARAQALLCPTGLQLCAITLRLNTVC